MDRAAARSRERAAAFYLFCPFAEYVGWIFSSVQAGMAQYPIFFTAHSLRFASGARQQARQTMERYFAHIRRGMAACLKADGVVGPRAFGPGLSLPRRADASLSGLAGIGHILVGAGLILLITALKKSAPQD